MPTKFRGLFDPIEKELRSMGLLGRYILPQSTVWSYSDTKAWSDGDVTLVEAGRVIVRSNGRGEFTTMIDGFDISPSVRKVLLRFRSEGPNFAVFWISNGVAKRLVIILADSVKYFSPKVDLDVVCNSARRTVSARGMDVGCVSEMSVSISHRELDLVSSSFYTLESPMT